MRGDRPRGRSRARAREAHRREPSGPSSTGCAAPSTRARPGSPCANCARHSRRGPVYDACRGPGRAGSRCRWPGWRQRPPRWWGTPYWPRTRPRSARSRFRRPRRRPRRPGRTVLPRGRSRAPRPRRCSRLRPRHFPPPGPPPRSRPRRVRCAGPLPVGRGPVPVPPRPAPPPHPPDRARPRRPRHHRRPGLRDTASGNRALSPAPGRRPAPARHAGRNHAPMEIVPLHP